MRIARDRGLFGSSAVAGGANANDANAKRYGADLPNLGKSTRNEANAACRDFANRPGDAGGNSGEPLSRSPEIALIRRTRAEKIDWIKAERDFLLARVRGHDDYRWVGSSSTAMVVSAITGEPPNRHPYDGWDLGRCLVRAVAPPHLHAAMDAILADWVPLVDRTNHHHGVAAARAMAEKETPVIQAILEAGSAPSTHGRRG